MNQPLPQKPSRSLDIEKEAVEVVLWQHLTLHTGSALLVLTGLPLAVFQLFLSPSDPFSAYLHPLQPVLLLLHALSIPLFFIGVGAFLVNHAAPHLREHLNAPSGLLLIVDVGIMTYSGILLLYLGSEMGRQICLATHILSGLAFPLILLVHIILGHR